MKNKSTNNLTNNCLSIKEFERNSREKERTNEKDGYNSYVGNNRRLAVSSHS